MVPHAKYVNDNIWENATMIDDTILLNGYPTKEHILKYNSHTQDFIKICDIEQVEKDEDSAKYGGGHGVTHRAKYAITQDHKYLYIMSRTKISKYSIADKKWSHLYHLPSKLVIKSRINYNILTNDSILHMFAWKSDEAPEMPQSTDSKDNGGREVIQDDTASLHGPAFLHMIYNEHTDSMQYLQLPFRNTCDHEIYYNLKINTIFVIEKVVHYTDWYENEYIVDNINIWYCKLNQVSDKYDSRKHQWQNTTVPIAKSDDKHLAIKDGLAINECKMCLYQGMYLIIFRFKKRKNEDGEYGWIKYINIFDDAGEQKWMTCDAYLPNDLSRVSKYKVACLQTNDNLIHLANTWRDGDHYRFDVGDIIRDGMCFEKRKFILLIHGFMKEKKQNKYGNLCLDVVELIWRYYFMHA